MKKSYVLDTNVLLHDVNLLFAFEDNDVVIPIVAIDSSSNGLTYVVERFKNEKIAGHVTLTKGERSKLAEIAANVL